MTLDLIVKVTILLVVATAIAQSLKVPALRHFVRSLALMASLSLPLLIALLPARNLAILPSSLPAPHSVTESLSPKNEMSTVRPVLLEPVAEGVEPTDEQGPVLPLVFLWEVGVLCCLTRLALGFYGLVRHRGPGSDLANVDLDDLAFRAGLRKVPAVRFAATPDVATAMTWGVIAPVVQLPVDARDWSLERLEAVLLHEFAHVRRRDFLSVLLGQLACALYWFHPMVWLSARAARSDAESAADDAVLHSGVRPSAYAAELLGLAAEIGRKKRIPVSLGVTIMAQSKIENRLQSVLSPRALRGGMTRLQALAVAAVAILAVPALAGLRAVALQRTPQERTLAMKQAKVIAIATLFYAQDYDDHFPNASSTAAAWKSIEPYATPTARKMDTPLTGPGKLNYNTHLSKAPVSVVPAPDETPSWVERLANPNEPFIVAYVDGHVHTRNPSERAAIEKALRERFRTTPLDRRVPNNQARRRGGSAN